MLRDAPMAGFEKLRCGIHFIDGRQLWAGVDFGQKAGSGASSTWFRVRSAEAV